MRTGRQIAGLSREKRCRIRTRRKPRRYHKEKRIQLSRDEMIDLLRRHEAHTAEKWRQLRRKGEPTVNDYRKEFDSWANAKAIAFPHLERPSSHGPARGGKIKKKKRPSRKGMRYRGRTRLDREGLTHFARSNDIRSTRQLLGLRKKKDPNVYDYREEWGSWSAAMEAIWGKDIRADFTPIYILQCICMYRCYKANEYRAERRENKDVPSMHVVMREYGSWERASSSAKALACEPAQQAYENLWEKMGRLPTVKDCEERGVNIQVLVDMYGSVEQFESMMRWVERIRENKQRSS